MTTPIHCDAQRRHDFVLLFDVTDGNPNGDPDAGNLPRIDPETMQGLVSDVAIKRKVRDYVHLLKGQEEKFKIYILGDGEALNSKNKRGYTALKLEVKEKKQEKSEIDRVRQWMCENFYDIRTFGAVMSTKVNAGQVRGPLQVTFARSIDQVTPLDITITRVAVTREEDLVNTNPEDGKVSGKTNEMGRKSLIPYGLYQASGFYNPHFAKQTGFDNDDLALFWQALMMMWDLDRSAARGMMTCRGIHIFSHTSPFGDAPSHTLFDRIQVARRSGVEVSRSFKDYTVDVVTDNLPAGVSYCNLVGS